jgi:hypothetical protein
MPRTPLDTAHELACADVLHSRFEALPGAARFGPTAAPQNAARSGHELAIAGGALRVPFVDGQGRLLGVLAVTEDLAAGGHGRAVAVGVGPSPYAGPFARARAGD